MASLAWDLPIEVNASCYIGRDIVNLGVFEPAIPEAIARLLDPGETAVDVGANVGQNASIMALVAGPTGRVLAVEPHPETSRRLGLNVARWARPGLAPIEVHAIALGASPGMATLRESDDFANNSGQASLVDHSLAGASHTVPVRTLDDLLGEARVGVLKIDVEGFEPAVLAGARRLVGARAIRDIVFEDRVEQPSETRRLLQSAGYVIFGLDRSCSRPLIAPPAQDRPIIAADYLATLDPERALARYRPRGWRCLRWPSAPRR